MNGRTLSALAFGALVFGLAASVPGVAFAQQQAPQDEAAAQAQQQQRQPLNNAPMWREVRSGQEQYTSIKGRETGVLMQTGGETWRQLRVPVETVGGTLIAFVLVALFGYYSWRGTIEVHDRPAGRYIRRFSPAERAAHWTMAISFVILAITGLIITFGKMLLIPVIGYTLFGWLAGGAKVLHNFTGPVFSVALPVFIVLFVRDNLPKLYDLQWIARFGGMLDKKGGHVASGRFNAGEKALFWLLVCGLCLILVITGLILDFPNFNQTRYTMQVANTIHMVAALLASCMAFFHIYLGTIGMRGAFQAMRYGYVDEAWAKEHHELWFQEVKAGTSRQRYARPEDSVPAEVQALAHGSH